MRAKDLILRSSIEDIHHAPNKLQKLREIEQIFKLRQEFIGVQDELAERTKMKKHHLLYGNYIRANRENRMQKIREKYFGAANSHLAGEVVNNKQ